MSPTRVQSLIGGRFEEPGSDEVDPIYDPATGETIAMLPYSTAEEIDRAVRAGKNCGARKLRSVMLPPTVLVDETAEQVSSTDFIGGTGRHFLF